MNSILFKLIIRDLIKNKFYSFITIFGLAVGMAATILLFIYAQHEFSYDKFHADNDRIFRLNSDIKSEFKQILPICLRLQDSLVQKQIPEVEDIFQLYMFGEVEFFNGDKLHKKIQMAFCDPSINNVFTLKYLAGNPDNALKNPESLVLTKKVAEKIFGSIDVIGKSLKCVDLKKEYTVSGVIDDFPATSHIEFGVLAPTTYFAYMKYFGGLEFLTYVKFKKNINLSDGCAKLVKFYDETVAKRFEGSGWNVSGFLINIKDIHLKADFNSTLGFDAPLKNVYIYLTMALIVLLIAIINFVNLLTVQYEGKSKEIGVQKAIGASRKEIIINFLGKSLAFSVIALIIAAIIVEFFIPSFGNIVNRDLVFTYRNDVFLIIGLPLLAIITGLISGIYPAFIISNYPPTLAIKGLSNSKKGSNRLTQLLVIFQFSITIFFLTCLLTINNQVRYMKNADLGFNYDRVVAITGLNEKLVRSYPSIKDALKNDPNITSIGASHHLMGGGVSGQSVTIVGGETPDYKPINEYRVLPGFVETLDFKFILGRAFDETIESDKAGVILNQNAVKMLGITDPLKTELFMNDTKRNVIGVIKDFHYSSFETSIEPIIFSYSRGLNYIMLKIKSDNVKSVLGNIESVLKGFDSQYVLDYQFIEDIYHQKFKQHEQTEVLSSLASTLSLILAMLGLYALAMFSVYKRTKEIGVRKVNGASSFQVVTILLSKYIKQVIIAFLVAAPISYIVMTNWLNGFVYRVKFSPVILVLSGIIVLLVALITVLGLSWNVASKNPVDSLRYE